MFFQKQRWSHWRLCSTNRNITRLTSDGNLINTCHFNWDCLSPFLNTLLSTKRRSAQDRYGFFTQVRVRQLTTSEQQNRCQKNPLSPTNVSKISLTECKYFIQNNPITPPKGKIETPEHIYEIY